ncbi:heavy-metal-associated domain-containing protein [Acidithiobacillus sp. M4-SHS-6]|uniref:CopZ family metallochaperone n=1 Tax=Acidithiobacillus sp. M4-SHS-6 TaxID=3383024 RepID=UPI0039BDBC05
MTKVEISIQGMTCQHCVAAVEKALRKIPEVQSVVVQLDTQSATVEGTSLDPEALIQAVEEEGYTAQVR